MAAEEARDGLNYRYIRQHVTLFLGPTFRATDQLVGADETHIHMGHRYGGDFDRVSAAVYAVAPDLKRRSEKASGESMEHLVLAGYETPQLPVSDLPSVGSLRFEEVIGQSGPANYRWWKTGLDRALAVAAIYHRGGGRRASGFLVQAGALGLEPADELLVLTNSTSSTNRAPCPVCGRRRPKSFSRRWTHFSVIVLSG